MCVPVTTVLLHQPSSHRYRRPLSFSPFAASPAVSPSRSSPSLSLSLCFLLSFSLTLLSPPSRHPSPCLQQPYKPWSSAGASSFTRAMYLDVSEGRNFASVCVNRSSVSLAPSRFLSVSPFLSSVHHPPLSPTLHGPLCPLPSRVSVLLRYQECVRATRTSRRARVFVRAARTYAYTYTRTHTPSRSVHT